jgi:osmotically-inducible protein OsmY
MLLLAGRIESHSAGQTKQGGQPMSHAESQVEARQPRKQLTDLLLSRGDCPIESLDVEVSQGAFILSGRVRSYYLKQLAQSIVRQWFPDVPLRNDIVVVAPQ